MTQPLLRRLIAASICLCGTVQANPAPTAPDEALIVVEGRMEQSLVADTPEQARAQIEKTPGSVDLVSAQEWENSEARTLKDVLDYTPGVIAQPKWGEDTRLSIRGSGLSRNFHLRGVALLVDGIPLNAADGSADFQEIDPTAFSYTEVYKGANALRYGASALGGAINFVSPTGYDRPLLSGRADFGSFGFSRQQLSGGMLAGAFDAYASVSHQEHEGFRDHSGGQSQRAAMNLGWRFSPELETRLYVLGGDIDQRIPGTVTRDAALSDPESAAANNELLAYQRNIKSWRVASRTLVRLDSMSAEFGLFAVEKQLIHPIFQYLDYQYNDRGAYARTVFEQDLFGHGNRFVFGANLLDGRTDNQQFQNLAGGIQGDLLSASADRSRNLTLYLENAFDVLPQLGLITGLQYVDAQRERDDRIADANDTSGRADYDFFSPKLGVLWRASPALQVFANVSRSAEPPTFGELNFTNVALSDTRAQRASTAEVGARSRSENLEWSLAIYHARIRDEFQFIDLGGGNYSVSNADKTVHQGVEAALAWTWLQNVFAPADAMDLHLSYTFSDFYFDDDTEWASNELPGAPRHYLRTMISYRHASGIYGGPNLEWVPQAYDVDNANTRQSKEYALVGFKLGYQGNEHWSLFVKGRNLADVNYIASTSVVAIANDSSNVYEPGTGRAVIGGIKLQW